MPKFRNAWLACQLALTLLVTAGVMLPPPVGQLRGTAIELPVHPEPLVVETSAGTRKFAVEVADDAYKRSRGLMYRQQLGESRGMLFVYRNARQVQFWMKNTPLPLDLFFIGADGRISSIREGAPHSEALIKSDVPIRYVLEANAGSAATMGIKPGDLVSHPVLQPSSR